MRKHSKFSLFTSSTLAALAALTTACGGAAEVKAPQTAASMQAYPAAASYAPSASSDEAAPAMMQQGAPPPMAPRRAGAPASMTSQPAPSPPPPTRNAPAPRGAKSVDVSIDSAHEPMIIYSGALQMMVAEDSFARTIDKAIDVAEAAGGYLAARKDDSVQLRVPSARFRESLTHLEALGAVIHRSVSASDVSEEYHDADVRLTNLRATRARLQEFLAKAPNVSDALAVERELERVAQEIDRLEGRLQFLKARAAYSQIDLSLEAKPNEKPLVSSAARPYVELPVAWLGKIGIDRLTTLR